MKKILILDDEPHIVRLLQVNLERRGDYVVTPTYDPKEALASLAISIPDAIILDLNLPNMGGLEVLKLVRADKRLDHVAVMILTVRAQDRDVFEGYRLGADIYLTKPFNPNEVLGYMARILSPTAPERDPDFEEPSIFRLASHLSLPSPEVFLATEKALKRLLRGEDLLATLRSIDPREFEELVEGLLSELGFTTRLAPRGADGGIDIVATHQSNVGEHCYYVQCKHYAEKPVGVRAVRELHGLVSKDNVTIGLLVASSHFTKPAMEFEREVPFRIHLAGQTKLKQWVEVLRS